MNRPALIFDFGNVVAFFDYRIAADKLGATRQLTGEALLEELRPLGFSDLLKAYESGKTSAEGFSRQVSRMIGLEITHEEFAHAWADIFQLNDSLAPYFERFQQEGYTLILGSNTNDMQATQFRHQFANILRHFDRLVLSYEVGHIKPSADFYLACARAANREPADCLFIDDLPENVEGAIAAGLGGILYESTEKLIRDLESLGIKLPSHE